MTLEEMTAQRDALLAARYRGVRTVEIDGRRVTYATDTEMAAAITDLERRIALASERRSTPANPDLRLEGTLSARVAERISGAGSGRSSAGSRRGLRTGGSRASSRAGRISTR